MKRRDAHGNGLIDDGEPFCIFYYEREMRNQSVNDSGGEKRLLSDFIRELRIIICVKNIVRDECAFHGVPKEVESASQYLSG